MGRGLPAPITRREGPQSDQIGDAHHKQLIEAARGKGIPVIYTTGERRPDNWDAGCWRWRSTRGDEASGTAHDDIDGNEIVSMIAPSPRDIVIKKAEAVGFLRE